MRFLYEQVMLRLSAALLALLFFLTAMIAPKRAYTSLKYSLKEWPS